MGEKIPHRRAFPAPEYTDGVVYGRIVPYNVVTSVTDETPTGLVRYREGFRLGAFARQASSTEPGVLRRVRLVHEHDGGSGYLGALMSLEERDDGLYGEFQVQPSRRDDANWLYHDIGVRELSVEFHEIDGGTEVDDNGVRWRTNVRMVGTALVAQGAYGAQGAEVLSVRDLDEVEAERAERERLDREAREAAEAAEHARVAAEEAEQRRRDRIAEIERVAAEQRQRGAELAARFR